MATYISRWEPARDYRELDARLGLLGDDDLKRATEAQDKARRGKSRNTNWGKAHDTRYIGNLGTRAVARYLKVPMDVSVNPHSGDKRVNLIGPNGVLIDVITRTPPTPKTLPDLTLRVKEKPRDDLALVLVVWFGKQWEPHLAGWLWESDLRAMDRRVTLDTGKHGGETFIASLAKLRPMGELLLIGPRTTEKVAVQGGLF